MKKQADPLVIPFIHLFGGVVCWSVLLLVATINAQAQYNYTTFSVPGGEFTQANGISGNNIVGDYFIIASPYFEGFLYNGGSYTTLSVPGAINSYASGISGNNTVGYYESGSGNSEGFLYNGSSYLTLSVPGAQNTYAYGISGNNIVGYYIDATGIHGFLYDGNSYNTLDVPGASYTQAYGIDGNNIVGYYETDVYGEYQSFLATPVPEPSVLWLLAGGSVTFIMRCRQVLR